MNILQMLASDTPWLADIVYPFLAGVCALVAVLSFSWYWMPPRPRHPLHFYIGLISATLVVPALLASAVTGQSPTYDITYARNILRLAWFMVGTAMLSVVVYYLRRFIRIWCAPYSEWSKRLQRWTPIVDQKIEEITK